MVIPGVLPSWLTPLATITDLIMSLSLIAWSRGFRIIIPQPSPRPYPVPRLSNENDLPSSENNLEVLEYIIRRVTEAYRDFDIDTQNSGSIFK